MGFLKRLEMWGKSLGALLLSVFLFRPFRRFRPIVPPKRVLLVRTDNRVGEALLTTPLLSALATLPAPPQVDVLVHAKVARVLTGHPLAHRILVLGRDTSLWALRRAAYDVVVDCGNWTAPSVHNAIYARLAAGSAPCLGPAAFPVSGLFTHPVKARGDTRSEVRQRLHLLSPLFEGPVPTAAMSYREPKVSAELAALIERVQTGPHAVVNPGGRLGWRRIDPATFAAAARALVENGVTPIVTWGPGEEQLAREVVAAAPGAEFAPPTDLDGLAALMRACGRTLCNNTGPMHLSVAMGVPTLAFFLHMDMERWGHQEARHAMVDFTPAVVAGQDPAPLAADAVRAFLNGRGR